MPFNHRKWATLVINEIAPRAKRLGLPLSSYLAPELGMLLAALEDAGAPRRTIRAILDKVSEVHRAV